MFMTFYNVDMEKAKNINDLLEEYERMICYPHIGQ